MAKNNKAADLLRLLGGKPTPKVPAQAEPPAQEVQLPKPRVEVVVTRSTAPARPAPKDHRGKAVQFWLHEEDRKLIREFAVWLLPHRRRINDSLVIKAVLRAAKTGPGLLAAYDDALTTDGRAKINKKISR